MSLARYQLMAASSAPGSPSVRKCASRILRCDALAFQPGSQHFEIVLTQSGNGFRFAKCFVMSRPLGLLRVLGHGASECGWMRPREHRQARDSIWILRSYQPCELTAPIMADEMEALRAARVHQGQRVARQQIACIRLYLERACPGRIASLIRSHGAKTRRRQARAIDGATCGASAEIHAAAGPTDPQRDRRYRR